MRTFYLLSLFFLFTQTHAQQIQAIKIGEAGRMNTNAYNYFPTIACLPEVGNGVITAIYGQNGRACGGSGFEDHIARYALSTDGGKTWDVGADTVPPPFTGCYGKGPVYNGIGFTRNPSVALFQRGNNTLIDSMGLVYTSPAFTGDPAFEGFAHSLILDPTDAQIQTTSEGLFRDPQKFLHYSHSLTPQVDPFGQQNFWTTSFDFYDYTQFFLVKGKFDARQKKVDWQIDHTVNMSNNGVLTRGPRGIPLISFDPSGRQGWVAMNFVQDSSMNPLFIRTEDGGKSWEDPEEVDLSQFQGLRERIYASKADSNSIVSCSGESALTVDAYGNPHFLVTVTVIDTIKIFTQGFFSYKYGAFITLYDITKEACSDNWELIYIDDIQFTFGEYGDPGNGTEFFMENFLQVSRSDNGEKIFFSWADTDTIGQANSGFISPDLKGAALDVNTRMMTPVMNWTENDIRWKGQALAPHTAPICLQNQDTFTVPTVISYMDSGISWDPVSIWYIPNIRYTETDFSIPVDYDFNCNHIQIAATPQIISPACGMADGSIQISPQGGNSPYTFQWGAAANFADSAKLVNLKAGVYDLVVTDSLGCGEKFEFILNNPNALPVTIDSMAALQPLCLGDSNGRLTVMTAISSPNFLWSNGETLPQATSLPAGRHTVQVSDVNNCQSFAFFQLEEPDSFRVTVATEPVNIFGFGEKSGTAQLNVKGGNGFPYRYQWSTGWTGKKAAGLGVGTHMCTITDADGCKQVIPVQVEGPTVPFMPVMSSTATSFCGSWDGTASIQIPGGNRLSYDWAGAGTGSFTFGLPPGLYQVKITDYYSNGIDKYSQVQVANDSGRNPVILADITPASCNGGNDGSVRLHLSGGSPPFTYTWQHGPTTSSLQNLAPGKYICEIGQNNDCSLMAHIWIPEDPSPRLEFACKDDPSSSMPQQATIEVFAKYGSPPYRYQWNTGDSLSLIQVPVPGLYKATVTDSKGCTVTDSILLEGSQQFSNHPIPASITHVCNGNGLGSIALQLSGNPTNYNVAWAHGPTTSSLQNLQAGTYTVTVFDSLLSCAREISYQIRNLAPLDLHANVHPVTCKGANDGKIDIQVTGGNATYQSLWAHGATGDHLRGLTPGNYTVKVIDPVGCTDSLTVSVVAPVDSLQLAVGSVSDGNPGGQAYAFASALGGSPPYKYNWNTLPMQITDTAQHLFGGTYEVTVTDSTGCIIRGEALVDAWVNLEKPVFPGKWSIAPNPNDGKFWLNIELESPQLIDVQIFDMKGQSVYLESLGLHASLEKHLQLNNLAAGLYLIQLKTETSLVRDKLLIFDEQ